jgi:hypothetical protein
VHGHIVSGPPHRLEAQPRQGLHIEALDCFAPLTPADRLEVDMQAAHAGMFELARTPNRSMVKIGG